MKKKERENRENGPKRPKKAKRLNFFSGEQSTKQNETKLALLILILYSGWKDEACDTNANQKLKNIENNLKMP